MSRSHTSGTAAVPPVVGWIAVAVAVAGLWVITYATLFPFDLVAGLSVADALDRFRLETGPVWAPRAVPANIALFVPLGVGLAGTARWRGWSRRAVLIGCTLAGLVLSAALELSQAMWLVRLPSLDDLLANTAGAALGALVWGWSETAIRRAADPRTDRRWWRRIGLVVGLAPMVLGLAAAAAASGSTEHLDWQPGSWLVLGNEVTGDRAWNGSLAEVALADRALTEAETRRWLDGTRLEELTAVGALLDERFDGSIPPGWQTQPDQVPDTDLLGVDGSLQVGPEQWLRSPQPVDELSARIAASGTFTVAVEATSETVDQTGPGRIVSVSVSPFQRNLTVGQDGSDLVVRVRSELTGGDGSAPEYAVRGFFDELGPHRSVIAYDGASLRVTDAHGGRHRSWTIELQPATASMLETFLDDVSRLYASPVGNVLRTAYLASFMFAPWCLYVGIRRARHGVDLLAAALVLVPVVGAELLLTVLVPAHDVHVVRIVVIAAAALALTAVVGAVTRRPRSSPAGAAVVPQR